MNEETKNLLNIAKKLAGKQLITYDELNGFVSDVANLLAQYRSATSQINKETKDTLNTLVKAIDDAHSQIISQQENKIDTKVSRETERLSKIADDCKKMCEEMLAMKPKDGKDGAMGEKGEKGDVGQAGKDGSPDTAEQVRDKLESLEGEERLDASAIKGIEKFVKTVQKTVNGGVRLLSSLMDVSISNPTNGQVLKYDATNQRWYNGAGGGGGSGSPGGLTTEIQFNDGGSFNGDAGLTYDKTTDVLTVNGAVHTPTVQAHTSAGVTIEAQGGADIAIFGAGGGQNATFYDGVKLNAQTASRILSTDASSNITALDTTTYPNLTELSYLKGVTGAIQNALDGKVDENVAITGGTKTKITYDAKGLVTAGADATTADIADSTNKRYVTDAEKANIAVLTNDSMADTLHRHSELSASDGSPNPAVFVDSAGNVGIGTTNPGAKLDVNGDIHTNTVINSGALGSFGAFTLKGAANGNTRFRVDQTSDNGRIRVFDSAETETIQFKGTGSSYINSGNLGIGTTTPLSKLAVSGGTSIGAGYNIAAPTNGLIVEGNVGIGTTSPEGNLTVYNPSGQGLVTIAGSANGGFLRVSQGINVAAGTIDLGKITSPTNGLGLSRSGGDGFLYYDTGNGDIVMNNTFGGSSLLNFMYGGSSKMVINSSGNLGIGTTTPTAKLDVNSDIIRLRTAKTPASAGATGNVGDICWDASYVYVCVATNTWKRSALSTW